MTLLDFQLESSFQGRINLMAQEFSGTELRLGNNESLRIMDDHFTVKIARELRQDIQKVVDDYNSQVNDLAEKVKDIVKKYEEVLKVVTLDGVTETAEEYEKRVEPFLAERKAALDAITPEDKEHYIMTLAFNCLKAIADKFGQGHKVTPQNFEAASWPKVKLALAKFLLSNEIPTGKLFLPPQDLD